MAPFHLLEFALHSGPITLDVLRVDRCDRVHEVQGVVYGDMCVDIHQRPHPAIGLLLVQVYGGVWQSVALNDWEKGGSSPVQNHLHVPQGWMLGQVNHPKNPHLMVGGSSSVVLHRGKKQCL